jgi:N-acetyl-anhydromuramyl-L-alanine amidase AmpD
MYLDKSGNPIRMDELFGVILHGSRSGRAEFSKLRGDGSEGTRTLAYNQQPGTTSYNWLVNYDGTIWEETGYEFRSWHAGSRTVKLHMNANWYGLCFAQSDVWEPLTDAQYASGKWLLGQINRRTGIPLVRQTYVPDRYAARGVTQHMDTGQGLTQGKSDVGPLLDWSRLF